MRTRVCDDIDSAWLSQAIKSYASFQDIRLFAYAVIGPGAILTVGSFLILGLFTQITALLAALILVPHLRGVGAASAVEDSLQPSLARRTIFKDLAILIRFLSVSEW